MKRLIFALVLVLLAVSLTSAHELTGTWVFIDGEESVDKTDYIMIDEEGYTHFEYQGQMSTGKLEKVKHGWVFRSDRGDFKISVLESLYDFENGSLGVSIISEYEDIQLGYFKFIEEAIE
jgi:hypothetical protein